MTRKALTTSVLFLLVLLTFSLSVSSISTNGKNKKEKADIAWATFDEGVSQAKKQQKLLVIDFYTDWCHWCKVMEKETYANTEVVAYAKEKAIMARINAETTEKFKFRDAAYSGRELSMMFGVRGFPTTVFMNAEGELITSISGFIPADRFKLILKYLADNWYEKMKFDEFEKQEATHKS